MFTHLLSLWGSLSSRCFQMSAERRPSFSDIVLTLEGMEGEEQKEASIALGKNVLRLHQM